MTPIDHKAVARDIVGVCNKHGLTNDAATKCLIYTATKLIAKRYALDDEAAAEILASAAIRFRNEISRVDRMFKNKE